jgi:hypothetical protein
VRVIKDNRDQAGHKVNAVIYHPGLVETRAIHTEYRVQPPEQIGCPVVFQTFAWPGNSFSHQQYFLNHLLYQSGIYVFF